MEKILENLLSYFTQILPEFHPHLLIIFAEIN